MPEDTKDVVDRFSAFKKAGMSPVLLVVMMVLSTPGFYNYLFDTTGEDAQKSADLADKKAEVSYEVVAAEIKELRNDNRELSLRVQNQHSVIMLLLQKGIGVEGEVDVSKIDDIVNTPVHRTAPSMGSRRPASAPEIAPVARLVPPEMLEEMVEQNNVQVEQRKAMPSLDDMVQKKNE